MKYPICGIWLLSFAFACLGCSEGVNYEEGVIVKGKLVQGGTPLQAPQNIPGATVNVQLTPVGSEVGAEPWSAPLGADGTFEIVGPENGIKPGRYKVGLSQSSYLDDPSIATQFSPENTPIEVEVPADKVGGVHDLGVIDLAETAKEE